MTAKTWTKDFYNSLYNEIWGETVTHPLVRRLLAFLMDYLIVFLINVIPFIMYLFDNEMQTFQTMTLNLVTGLLYFTILNSSAGNGQTIGKRLFKIRVLTEKGETINLATSFLRSLPIALIINGYIITLTMHLNDLPFRNIVHGLLIYIFGTIYFSIINQNRQGLHDLILGTQVVSSQTTTITTRELSIKAMVGFIIPVTLYVVYWTIK